MPPSQKIAACVMTKNEERHIGDCLDSLKWADELVVLDSFSSDKTVEIATSHGARVFQRSFENFSKQRNHALDVIESPWVLFVDADERVTPELVEEVRDVVACSAVGTGHVGFWVPRHNIIWGKQIQHAGWYPDRQLRLLRVQSARYDELRAVHEVAEMQGTTANLKNPLIHYNYDTVRQFLAKQEAYSTHEAQLMLNGGVRPRWRNYLGAPAREFDYRYRKLEGFKDGLHGLTLSLLLAWYKYKAYVKLKNLLG